ncbi:MAG: carboxypeptidase regulatory-like domain-containing protein [Bacteroidia bacterium]
MKKLVILFFILLPFFGFTQITTGTIKVHVFDENGEDFLGTNVAVYQGDKFIKGNASDPFGLATITNLEPGEYILKVSSIGYENAEVKFKISAVNITYLEIELEPATEELSRCCFGCNFGPPMLEPYGGSTPFRTEKIIKMPVR